MIGQRALGIPNTLVHSGMLRNIDSTLSNSVSREMDSLLVSIMLSSHSGGVARIGGVTGGGVNVSKCFSSSSVTSVSRIRSRSEVGVESPVTNDPNGSTRQLDRAERKCVSSSDMMASLCCSDS